MLNLEEEESSYIVQAITVSRQQQTDTGEVHHSLKTILEFGCWQF